MPPTPPALVRRRIVALPREYPEGLSPARTRHLLGIVQALGAMMKAMARDGLLRRVEAGWYAVNDPTPGENESSRTTTATWAILGACRGGDAIHH